MPTSFLAPLPGNGSNTRFRVSQPYDFSSYPMEFSPSYPVVPSSEYLEPPPSCHPILSDGYEIRPSLVAMVHAQSFSGRKDECPYAHLQVFEKELFSSDYTWYDSTHPMVEAITVQARIWYNRTARGVRGDWIQLKDEFYLFFYPISKVIAHRNQLMTFEQGDESLGVALG